MKLKLLAAFVFLSLNAAHAQLYSANFGSNTVTAFNTNTDTQTTLISSSEGLDGPAGVAIIGNDLFVSNYYLGTIAEFNLSTGAVINSDVLGGLAYPTYMVASGNSLYLANTNANEITKMTVSGTTVTLNNYGFVSTGGSSFPEGMAILGNTLYVSNIGPGTITTYNLTTGAFTGTLVAGLNNPFALTIDGGDLFVANKGNNEISEYTLAGALVNADFVSTSAPFGLTDSSDGSDLFVANNVTGVVGEYSATTGAVINADYMTVSGPTQLLDVAMSPIATPEPKSWAFALGVLALVVGLRFRPDQKLA